MFSFLLYIFLFHTYTHSLLLLAFISFASFLLFSVSSSVVVVCFYNELFPPIAFYGLLLLMHSVLACCVSLFHFLLLYGLPTTPFPSLFSKTYIYIYICTHALSSPALYSVFRRLRSIHRGIEKRENILLVLSGSIENALRTTDSLRFLVVSTSVANGNHRLSLSDGYIFLHTQVSIYSLAYII